MIAVIAADELQMVINIPVVRSPPLSPWEIFLIWSVMIDSTSGGAKRPSRKMMSSMSRSTGK